MPDQPLSPSEDSSAAPIQRRRSTPTARRVTQLARRLLITLAAALALTWLLALVLAWTIDPRLGATSYAETWTPPGTLITTQVWSRPTAAFVERFWQHDYKRPWGPEQAAGGPDTQGQGDIPTAWAPATPDGQAEWLKLRWPTPVAASEIVVYQSHNPGAIVRIRASRAGGAEETIWTAPAFRSPESSVPVLIIPIDPAHAIDTVILDLNSPAVPGWNEIDAVCLKDPGGKLVGASNATASSTYAERTSPGPRVLPTLPTWSGLSAPPSRPEGDPVASERRAEGAFGWPFPAWVAVQALEFTPAAGGSRRTKPFAMIAPPGSGPLRAVPYRPIVSGLAINILVYGLALWILQLGLIRPLRPIRRLIRMQRGHCPDCGYDLGYNFSGGCSECGLLRGR